MRVILGAMMDTEGQKTGWLETFFYQRFFPLVVLVLTTIGLFYGAWLLENPVFDRLLNAQLKQCQSSSIACHMKGYQSPVVIVALDDRSLVMLEQKFGSKPWRHPAVFEKIASFNPAAIVFDGVMDLSKPESDEQKKEQAGIQRLLKTYPNLVVGVSPDTMSSEWDAFSSQLGAVRIYEDHDGVIRDGVPWVTSENGVFPSLSLQGVVAFLNSHTQGKWQALPPSSSDDTPKALRITNTEETMELPLYHVPNNSGSQAQWHMRWQSVRNPNTPSYKVTHPVVPIQTLFDEALSAEIDFSNHIVLVGSTSLAHRDNHPTPVARHHAGPDIQATMMDNILSGQSIRVAPWWINMLIAAVLALVAALYRVRIQHSGKSLFFAVGTALVYVYFCYDVLLAQHSYKVWVVIPVLVMAYSFVWTNIVQFVQGTHALRRLEKNLSRLVSNTVFQEIQTMENGIEANGKRMVITSMFVDIRNFTHIASEIPPQSVTSLLNEFYSVVVDVVFKHRGTVDKFMGDGILIMFGAPIEDDNHREMALEAAKEILNEADLLVAKWKEERNIETKIGVSLSSGPAFVGFIGPEVRLEYTAIGDTVNLCVRLQKETANTKSGLILSEYTAEPIQENHPELKSLGQVAVRGRKDNVTIYTVE